MAQTNYTPISLYYSTTPTAVPVNTKLVNGELAINIADGKLYYKDSSNVVQLLANTATVNPVTTISFGSTGLTPSSATSGAVTVSGTLNIANGGTGQTSASAAFNALSPITTLGDLIVGDGTNSAIRLGIGANNTVLTSDGSTASWVAISSESVVTFSGGTTGLTPSIPTNGDIVLDGTLITSNGGTGVSSYTAGDMLYYTSGTALTNLGIGSNGQLLTISGGVPSWQNAPATGVTSFQTSLSGLTPSTSTTGAVTLAGTLGATSGGTSQSTYATGDILYASATDTLSKLPASSDGYVLKLATGVPAWVDPGTGGATISNDTTTASNLYPLFAAATSGVPTSVYTSNAKYLYKPSTGELQASEVVSTNGIVVNADSVSANYTLSTGFNGMSVGPVAVASGITVTVSSGQRWVIL